jgi:hypothetical protein
VGQAAKDMVADRVVWALGEALDGAIKAYEKSGQKVPVQLASLMKNFVKVHGGMLVRLALGGRLQSKHVVAIFVRMAEDAGVVLDSADVSCGVALFEVCATAYDAIDTTAKVARASAIVGASGVGAPAAAVATAAAGIFGGLMTLKDGYDAYDACNEAISRRAAAEKRPPVVIGLQGYNLGQISTLLSGLTGPQQLMCEGPRPALP